MTAGYSDGFLVQDNISASELHESSFADEFLEHSNSDEQEVRTLSGFQHFLETSPHISEANIYDAEGKPKYVCRGIGNSFLVTAAPGVANNALKVAIYKDSQMQEVDVEGLVYVDGIVLGGYQADGTELKSTNLEDFYDEVRLKSEFERKYKEELELVTAGFMPIFQPGELGFELTSGSTSQQRAMAVKLEERISTLRLAEGITDTDERQTPTTLAEMLRPAYEITSHGATFSVSKPFVNVEVSRKGAIDSPHALLYTDKSSTDPMLVYRSQSHAVWRAMLARTESWYAKGMFGDENSADAPIAVQRCLSLLLAQRERYWLPSWYIEPDAQTTLVPTIGPLSSPESEEHSNATPLRKEAMMYACQRMLDAGVSIEASAFTRPFNPWRHKTATRSRLFRGDFAPATDKPLTTWAVRSKLYGVVNATLYPSRNGQVHYVFHESETANGRQYWVATAEMVDAKMTNLGILDSWPILSDEVTKPPIDYMLQVNEVSTGYGERRIEQAPLDVFVRRSLSAHLAQRKRQQNEVTE